MTKLTLPSLQSLPFEKVAHIVGTQDAQPSSATVASLVVHVTGQLKVDDNPSMQYSQVFQVSQALQRE